MRLVRASIFERMDGDDGKAGLLSVEKGMERLSQDDQYRLLQGLVQKYRQRKDRESATRLLGRMMEQWKNDLFSRSLAFDMAREDGDVKTLKRLVDEIRTVSGPKSPFPPVFDAVSRITSVSVAQKAKLQPGQTKFELTSDDKRELQDATKLLEQVCRRKDLQRAPQMAGRYSRIGRRRRRNAQRASYRVATGAIGSRPHTPALRSACG